MRPLGYDHATPRSLVRTASLILGCDAGPAVVEVRVQAPEPLIDAARDLSIDRRAAGILDIRGARNAPSHRPGVVREALRQRQHMGVAVCDRAGILRQPRLARPGSTRTDIMNVP
jgi:hypothetical protein